MNQALYKNIKHHNCHFSQQGSGVMYMYNINVINHIKCFLKLYKIYRIILIGVEKALDEIKQSPPRK